MKSELETSKYFATTAAATADFGAVTCCCCGARNGVQADACNKCHIPLSISITASARGVKPQFIPVLGGSGAGKTVYIGMLLDMLSKGRHEIAGQANNSFSVAVQQETLAALERRRFPEKTVTEVDEWNWVHCEVQIKDRRMKHPLDLVAPDLAGEAVSMELDHPDSFPIVKTCVSQACAVILLIDALKARDHGTDEDLLATKIATYIYSNARRNGLVRKSVNIPLAITFTKTDLCEEAAEDPQKFAKHNLPAFFSYCERNLPKHAYFSASVVGSVTRVSDEQGDYYIPLHVQPTGIIEPLSWVTAP